MNINSIISQINNAFSGNTVNTNAIDNSTMQALENGLNKLLSNDSSAVAGKILSITGQDMILELGENELLSAKLDGNLKASVGDILTFQVKGNASNKITLSALFENTNQESTVNSALKAANIPNTPENQYMVKTMMQEGLPIDKSSLYEMSTAMKMNSTADVLDLAKMTRLDIPLNEQNINQFSNYQNLEHEITKAFSDITNSFSEGFILVSNEDGVDAGLIQLTNSLDILINVENELGDDVINNDINTEGKTSWINNSENVNDKGLVNYANNSTVEVNSYPDNSNDLINSLKNLNSELKLIDLSKAINEEKTNQYDFKSTINNINELIKDIDLKNIDQKDIPELRDDIKKILQSDVFKNSLNKIISNKYELLPDEVSKDNSVHRVYERLASDLNKLNSVLNSTTNNPLAESVKNLSDNINFMNELNQTFNYVQIPLKMTNNDASGELYVYTNKKSLSSSDGQVSALLHLDMEYLGPMNVHVLMNSNTSNVSTKFYLADDSALDLISNNIDLLNSRLNKRGYSVSNEFVNESNQKSVLNSILDDNKNISVISSNSFDARA